MTSSQETMCLKKAEMSLTIVQTAQTCYQGLGLISVLLAGEAYVHFLLGSPGPQSLSRIFYLLSILYGLNRLLHICYSLFQTARIFCMLVSLTLLLPLSSSHLLSVYISLCLYVCQRPLFSFISLTHISAYTHLHE